MKVNIATIATLTIDKYEANWLKEYTQNYVNTGEESTESKEIRKRFFDAAKRITDAWNNQND